MKKDKIFWESETEKAITMAKIKKSMYDSIKKGYTITNPKMTADEFLKLSPEKQNKIKITLTEKGKKTFNKDFGIDDNDFSKKAVYNAEELFEVQESKMYKIAKQVNQTIYDGIKKGHVIFEKKQLKADEWLNMSARERENHPFKWKENTNPLMESIFKQMAQEDRLVKKVYLDKKTKEVKIELTSDGEILKTMGEMMGIDMISFWNNIVKKGVNKHFSEFIWIDDVNKTIQGNSRYEV
jgi:hypothetical protein